MSRYVIRPTTGPAASREIGGKAAALAELGRAGLSIPDWFVVAPGAFLASIDEKRLSALEAACQQSDAAAARDALQDLRLGWVVEEELQVVLAEASWAGKLVAVRSSAPEEDGRNLSFAGQLDSFLNVPLVEVAGRIVDVWRGSFSERLLAYRRRHGLSTDLAAPAVIVQLMVAAEVAGVAYSADPVSGRRGIAVVCSAPGLGDRVVSGSCDSDTYRVGREGYAVGRSLAGTTSSLTDQQVGEVAALARRCERHFRVPQDIEWAYSAGGQLWLLQSRPITGLRQLPDPDGSYARWDNSNIAESYSGVTTPLTFSFASHAYRGVYRQLCRLLGVPEAELSRHDEAFGQMIGLIRGRIYYNLLSWYELLALAPGFASNRRFMEQMMGVREGLPDHIVAGMPSLTWRGRWHDRLRIIQTAARLIQTYLHLPANVERFTARTEQALADSDRQLESLRPDELVACYRELERRLLTHWDAPLINDLFTMIWFGLLRSLSTTWCGDSSSSFTSALIAQDGGAIISAEPATRVRRMARVAAGYPGLTNALVTGSLSDIGEAMADVPEFDDEFTSYLHKFADRCLEELKLESPTLADDPLPLLRSVGQLAASLIDGDHPEDILPEQADGEYRRAEAEHQVRRSLAHHPFRRLTYLWILRQARALVRNRENLRFLRTRVFGRVRHIFVELGNRFYAYGLLERPEDIFYLEVEEALGLVTGTATTTDVAGLVAVRQAEFARYRDELEPPADSFETYGMVFSEGNLRCTDSPGTHELGRHVDSVLMGTGCCPGIVSGAARVVTDPRREHVRPGEILVAERTDPGWILLFASAAGVVVEHGSLLSHSAIVARELGIPTVVAAPGATRRLRTGDWIQLDGSSGIITRIPPPAAQSAAS
jgi:rifampicin phosphotransferase